MTPQDLQEMIEKIVERIMAALEKRLAQPPQEWFSIKQAAALTGLSSDHLRRHVVTGKLPASNQGSRDKPLYRIRKKDLDDWMESRKEAPQPAPRKRKQAPAPFVSKHFK